MGGDPGVELVGRAGEVAALAGVLGEAIEGRGGVALLEGSAGIGKTRLVEEMVRQAEALGLQVTQAGCHELEKDRPFGPLIDGLGIDVRSSDPTLAALARRFEVTAGTDVMAVDSISALRFGLVDLIVDHIEGISMGQPLLVVIDDLHWADTSTIATLHRLARRAGTFPLAVMTTARFTPRSPEVGALAEVVKARGGLYLVVDPLGEDAVDRLLELHLGAKPGPILSRRAQGAGGNPFYLTELLSGMARDGQLRVEQGVVELDQESTPSAVRAAVVAGLRQLSPLSVEVLQAAAILGSAFDARDLAVCMGLSARELTTSIAESRGAGVLIETGDQLRFRHDLVREAVYEDIPISLRRALHRDAAAALARAGAPTLRVAAQFRLGAGPGDFEAALWLRRAARETIEHDARTAADLLSFAFSLMGESDADRVAVGTDLVVMLDLAGRAAESQNLARRLLATRPALELELRLRTALHNSVMADGRPAEALSEIEPLERRRDLPDGDRAVLLARRSAAVLDLGDITGARQLSAEAIQLGERAGEDVAVVFGTFNASVAAFYAADYEQAMAYGQRALSVAATVRLFSSEAVFALQGSWYGYVLACGDRCEDARSFLVRVRSAPRSPMEAATDHYCAGLIGFLTGEWDDAIAECESGLALTAELGYRRLQGVACTLLVLMALARDDLALAESSIGLVPQSGNLSGPDIYFVPFAEALLADAKGDGARALSLISESWKIVTAVGVAAHYPYVGPDYVRLQLAHGDRDAATAGAAVVAEAADRSPQVASLRGAALWCRGLATGDAEVLLESVRVLATSPRRVETAFAATDAAEALIRDDRRAEATRLLEDAAVRFAAAGATRGQRRVEGLMRQAGVRRLRPLRPVRPNSGWGSLTPSENKIAELIATGLTSREIADRLYNSPRTVDTHVAHIMSKLQIRSRREIISEFAGRA